MLNVDTQLKLAYEGGLTPEQIAHDQSLDIVAVKAKLMQVSSQYRKDCGEPEGKEQNEFTQDEDELAKRIILETMTSAERIDGSIDHKTRLDAAKYIRDDKRGRHDRLKTNQLPQFNLINFNQAIMTAKERSSRALTSIRGNKEIEV